MYLCSSGDRVSRPRPGARDPGKARPKDRIGPDCVAGLDPIRNRPPRAAAMDLAPPPAPPRTRPPPPRPRPPHRPPTPAPPPREARHRPESTRRGGAWRPGPGGRDGAGAGAEHGRAAAMAGVVLIVDDLKINRVVLARLFRGVRPRPGRAGECGNWGAGA